MTIIDRDVARRLAIAIGVKVAEVEDEKAMDARAKAFEAVNVLVKSEDPTERAGAVADMVDALQLYYKRLYKGDLLDH